MQNSRRRSALGCVAAGYRGTWCRPLPALAGAAVWSPVPRYGAVLAAIPRLPAPPAHETPRYGVAALVSTYNVENLLFVVGVPYGPWANAVGTVLSGLVLLVSGLVARAQTARPSADRVPA